MSEYSLGETVYYVEYISNAPYARDFIIAAVRETENGYSYSQFKDPAYPYIAEDLLFATLAAAVAYQITLLEALLPS